MPGAPGPKGEKGLGLVLPKMNNELITTDANLTDNVAFQCVIFGNPIPTVKWNSNGQQTNITSHVDYVSSQITSRLTIRNISWEDRGSVSCFAESILGKVNATALLNVHGMYSVEDSQILFSNLGQNLIHKRQIFPKIKTRSNSLLQVNINTAIHLVCKLLFDRDLPNPAGQLYFDTLPHTFA